MILSTQLKEYAKTLDPSIGNVQHLPHQSDRCTKDFVAVPYLMGDVRVITRLQQNAHFKEIYIQHQNEVRILLSGILSKCANTLLLADSIGSSNEVIPEGFILTDSDLDDVHAFEKKFCTSDKKGNNFHLDPKALKTDLDLQTIESQYSHHTQHLSFSGPMRTIAALYHGDEFERVMGIRATMAQCESESINIDEIISVTYNNIQAAIESLSPSSIGILSASPDLIFSFQDSIRANNPDMSFTTVIPHSMGAIYSKFY